MNDVALTIDKRIVDSVVRAKIHGAVVDAMKGHTEIIDRMLQLVLETNVDPNGKPVDRPRHGDGSTNFLDWLCQKTIREAARSAVVECVESNSKQIQDAVVAALKRNPTKIAKALIAGAEGALTNQYRFELKIEFLERSQ